MLKQNCISRQLVSALALGSLFATANANLILNGSFEANSAGTTVFNMSNGTVGTLVSDVTAFGAAGEIDLIKNSSNPYGLATYDGDYRFGLHTQSPGGAQDGFAFHLSGGIVAGTVYTLSFGAHAVVSFDPGLGPVEVGISSSSASFGTIVYSTGATLSTSAWTVYSTTFTAPISASFVTVRTGASDETWAHVDAFYVEAVPEPTTMIVLGASLAGLLARRRRH